MGVVNWNPVAGWMAFPQLSQNAGITHAYALGYKLKDDGQEPWTKRFSRFKEMDPGAVNGGARLLYGAVPPLIDATGVDLKDTVFIAALSSGETTAQANRAIPYIASQCAGLVGARFELNALQKNAHKKIHTFFSVEERNAELDKAEYVSAPLGAGNIVVFDDFITRGDTLSRIALAILETNPKAKVYGVALAKNESVAWCPNPKNDQMSAKWDKLWEQGEQEALKAK